MKKGINVWSFPQGTVKDTLTLAKKAGFEGVELALNGEGELSLTSTEAEIKRVKQMADDMGLALYSLSCGLCWDYRLSDDDPAIRQKAKDIIGACQMLIAQYDSKVPGTMEELLKLPGVGRKTANLLLGDIFKTPGSVVCDTHCIRICGRLGLSQGKEPEKVEHQLRKILPPEESNDFCHRIVQFGRDTCTARSPKCGQCPLRIYCKEFNPDA